MVAVALILAILFNSSANILIKLGMQKFKESREIFVLLSGICTNWQLMLGMIFFALNLGCYAYALSRMKLSVAYPIMMSMSFGIVIATSAFYLKETLSREQIFGLFFILTGVVLVAKDLKT